jgi:hypothetical protein
MSIDLLVRGIQEENGRDLDKEVVRILMNEEYWERLKEERQLGGNVQVAAIGPDEVQFCFCGIPVEFREGVEYFSLETASRNTI